MTKIRWFSKILWRVCMTFSFKCNYILIQQRGIGDFLTMKANMQKLHTTRLIKKDKDDKELTQKKYKNALK